MASHPVPVMRATYDEEITGCHYDRFDLVGNPTIAGRPNRPFRNLKVRHARIKLLNISKCSVCGEFDIFDNVIETANILDMSLNKSDIRGIDKLYINYTTSSGSVTVSSIASGIDVQNSKFNSLTIHGHRSFNPDSATMPSLTLRNMSGLENLFGSFDKMSFYSVDLTICNITNCTGVIASAYNTMGDGTYLKNISYGRLLFTYSHDRVWVAMKKRSRYRHREPVTTFAIDRLATDDSMIRLAELDTHAPNVVDMILDNPAEPLPEKRD